MRSNKLPKQFHKFFGILTRSSWIQPNIINMRLKDCLIWAILSLLSGLRIRLAGKKLLMQIKTGREINNKTANFFQIIYNIPKKEICVFAGNLKTNSAQFGHIKPIGFCRPLFLAGGTATSIAFGPSVIFRFELV